MFYCSKGFVCIGSVCVSIEVIKVSFKNVFLDEMISVKYFRSMIIRRHFEFDGSHLENGL